MKLQLLLVATLLLTACQQRPHIYITNQGYSDEQVNRLLDSINKLDADITVTDLSVPEEFSDTAILMHPVSHDPVLLAQIERALLEAQFTMPDYYPFAKGLHFYNQSSVGVYLRNPALTNYYKMPRYLRTQYCNWADATAAFLPNGQFVFEYELLNQSKKSDKNKEDDFDLQKLEGEWSFANNGQLQLKSELQTIQRYLLSHAERDTFFGMRPADIFTPQLQSDKLFLNCELVIIYGE